MHYAVMEGYMNFGEGGARVFRVGNCLIDAGKQCVIRNSASLDSGGASAAVEGVDTVQLAPRDFQVLLTLLERAPDLVSGSELLGAAWRDKVVCGNVVYQSIGRLRAAFGDTPAKSQYIVTVSKRGYRLVASTAVIPPPEPAPQPAVDKGLAPVLIAPFERLGKCDLAPAFVSTLGFEIGHQLLAAGVAVIQLDEDVSTADRFSQARRMGAQTVMEASLLTNSTKVRVMVTLTDVASRVQIWSGRYDLPIDEVFDIQCLLAEAAVEDICAKLPERLGPRAAPRHADDADAATQFHGQVIGLN
jgi:DNA-binding winged helix-turn-helix (wHTH) protein